MGHRIIVTGKNSAFPNTVSLPWGVAVDGTVATRPVRIRANEAKCRRCDGWGSVETWDGNPSHREVSVGCTACDGTGIVEVAA